MKIGFDCRLAGPKHAGIGRYITELLNNLLLDSSHDWVLFFYDKQQVKEVLPGWALSKPNIKVVLTPIKHYSISEQLQMPSKFQKESLDLLHVPHFNLPIFYFGKTVVTIHDLLWHNHKGKGVTTLPSWQYWIKYLGYRLVASASVHKARAIITPSNTIKKELSKYYQGAEAKTFVITEGFASKLASSTPSPQKTGTKKVNKTPNQILFVGSLYPHKNIEVVIKALKKLPKYTLIIAGARSIFMEKTKKLVDEGGVASQVNFVGRVSDSELSKLYRQSVALVLPSLSEGFGLTGLEALALSTPILVSDIPIFHEIYGESAIYFDPHSPDSFIKNLDQLETLNIKEFEIKARKTVQKYSWEKASRATLEVYKSVK